MNATQVAQSGIISSGYNTSLLEMSDGGVKRDEVHINVEELPWKGRERSATCERHRTSVGRPEVTCSRTAAQARATGAKTVSGG